MTVIRADGTTETRDATSFKRERIDENGLCRRCGSPVKYVPHFYIFRGQRRKTRKLVDAYGYQGQEHACAIEVRARSLRQASGSTT